MTDKHCPSPVTQRECDKRHQGTTRWWVAVITLFGVSVSTAGTANIIAWGAARDIAVHKAAQVEVNKNALELLKRIETDVRALRNGHEQENEMATYAEVRGLFGNSLLRNKVEVACIIAAKAVLAEDGATPNHANRLLWAAAALNDARAISERVLTSLLIDNKDLEVGNEQTVGTILGASDGQIQALVDAAVDVFADGS